MTIGEELTREEQMRRFHEDLAQGAEYVHKNMGRLIPIYGGKWVMVYGSRIVDSDPEEFELAKRHEQRYDLDFDRRHTAVIIHVPKTVEQWLSNQKSKRREDGHYADFESPDIPLEASQR